MSDPQPVVVTGIHLVGVHDLRKRWGWFVGLGVLLVILGMLAIGSSVLFTLATMVFLGWLMFLAGVLQTAHGFTSKNWGGFFIDLVIGLLYTVTAFMVMTHPGATGIALTLLIAMLLIVSGVFRIVVSFAARFQNGVWLLLHGVINIALGVMIWQDWPASGLWVIGLFVGIDMLFNGWSLIMLGIAAKNLPQQGTPS